ncbi:uncharacterized protein LOC120423937 isoform X1 [Culex pipiens pallens]|uniref:uncharacterized protein LOC120423937 isoform X1 n=1 Tax=Culex pipiens pallens TaxID=42434 RepID=UPI00195398C7|nr:uncharacterized protein LOC120423937 isoform X1 [Culex pipiens pallens]
MQSPAPSHRSKMKSRAKEALPCPVTWIRFTLTAAVILLDSAAQGLLCRQCFSLVSWDDCERVARDNLCTTVGVNTSNLNLLHENPTLALGNLSEFRCYKYQARINRHNDRGLVTGYGRGCTFAVGDFCSGWKPAVAVKQCDVCDDRDLCNRGGGRAGPEVVVVLGVAAVMAAIGTGRYN